MANAIIVVVCVVTKAAVVLVAVVTSDTTRSIVGSSTDGATGMEECAGVERSTAKRTLWRTPANLASEGSVLKATVSAVAIAKIEGRVTHQGNVVEAEVPDGGIQHAVGREGEHSPNDGTSEDVVPVVILVNGKSTADESCTKKRGIDSNELPHGRMVVGEDLDPVSFLPNVATRTSSLP